MRIPLLFGIGLVVCSRSPHMYVVIYVLSLSLSLCLPPQLNNLTLMEINTVRPFLTQALDHTHLLRSHAQLHASDQISDSTAF
jgi:hypothetical protein